MNEKSLKTSSSVWSADLCIVGVGLRLPGKALSLGSLAQILTNENDVIADIGSERWNKSAFYHRDNIPGHAYNLRGGIVEDIYDFDADFFGMSPREVKQTDPQHRMLLQTTWEAFENAGIDPFSIKDRNIDVFVGISATDYGTLFHHDIAMTEAHFMPGNAMSIAANRLSYFYDFHGESMAIDTACSSSLVALHKAAQSIVSGNCEMAVVGGSHALLNPYPFVAFSKAGMLSRKGHCFCFDQRADGYVRAEGSVTVLVTTKEKALQEGWPVLCVLKGGGMNTDGGKSFLLAPNYERQKELIYSVREAVKAKEDDYLYFEAHGTGTPVGDPSECNAIGSAIAVNRKEHPLPVGSVKSHIGHTEPVSGLAGLAKVITIFQNGEIPANTNFKKPSKAIDFKKLNLEVVTRKTSLKQGMSSDSVIGLNSFGFGGVNAHIVAAPFLSDQESSKHYLTSGARMVKKEETCKTEDKPAPLFLSAHSEEALVESARNIAEYITDETDIRNLSYSLYSRRAKLAHCAVIDPFGNHNYRDLLQKLADTKNDPGIIREKQVKSPQKTVFVYNGNGAQWLGMGKDIANHFPEFQKSLNEFDKRLKPLIGWSVRDWFVKEQKDEDIKNAEIIQPVVLALQIAITDTLRFHGIMPDYVIGHSVGEISAAYACGAINAEEAICIIKARCEAQKPAKGKGLMAAASFTGQEIEEMNEKHGYALSVASYNAPNSITITGSHEEIENAGNVAQQVRKTFKTLESEYPYHSPIMESGKSLFIKHMKPLNKKKTLSCDFISTVSGKLEKESLFAKEYWWQNIRNPVLFQSAIEEVCRIETKKGSETLSFIEIGPSAILQSYIRKSSSGFEKWVRIFSTQQRNTDGPSALRKSLYQFLAAGLIKNEDTLIPKGRFLEDLPPYPWTNQTYIFTHTPECVNDLKQKPDHFLLGYRQKTSSPYLKWSQLIDPVKLSFLQDHKFDGSPVFPAAFFTEMAIAAAKLSQDTKDSPAHIQNFKILNMLKFDGSSSHIINFEFLDDKGHFRITGRPYLDDKPAVPYVIGKISMFSDYLDQDIAAAPVKNLKNINGRRINALARQVKLEYGKSFRLIKTVAVSERIIDVEFKSESPDNEDYLNPFVLDSAFQGILALLDNENDNETVSKTAFLPVGFEDIVVHSFGQAPGSARILIKAVYPHEICTDINLYNMQGHITASLRNMRFRKPPENLQNRVLDRFIIPESQLLPFNDFGSLKPEEIAESCSIDFVREEDEAAILINAVSIAFLADVYTDIPEDSFLVDKRAQWIRKSLENAGYLEKDTGKLKNRMDDLADFRELALTIHTHFPDLVFYVMLLLSLKQNFAASFDTSGTPEENQNEFRNAQLFYLLNHSVFTYNVRHFLCTFIQKNILEASSKRIINIAEICDRDFIISGHIHKNLKNLRVRYTLFISEDDIPLAARLVRDIPQINIVPYENIGNVEHKEFDVLVDTRLRNRNSNNASKVQNVYSMHNFILDLPETPEGFLTSLCMSTENPESGLENNRTEVLPQNCFGIRIGQIENNTREMPELSGRYGILTRHSPAYIQYFKEAISRCGGQTFDFSSLADAKGTETIVYSVVLASENDPSHLWDIVGDLKYILTGSGCSALWVISEYSDEGSAYSAFLKGFIRSAANEYSTVKIHFIEIDTGTVNPDLVKQQFIKILTTYNEEPEIGVNQEGLHVIRFTPRHEQDVSEEITNACKKLVVRKPGTFRNLEWVTGSNGPVQDNEVKIRVMATSLNYRDVLWAKGLLEAEMLEDGYAKPSLGIECTGVVEKTGSGVKHYKPGDTVMAYTGNAFADTVNVPAHSVAPMPKNISFEQAATIPVTFMTAYYALVKKAAIQKGEKVLIHGAAGGVGLAAIQIAKHFGAEIYVTAGNEEKRAYLECLGVKNIYNSRDLAFHDQILKDTNGYGVDVVLNSLSGKAIDTSLALLAAEGRFAELGKRDIYADSSIGLRPFRRNISYFAIDMDQLILGKPQVCSTLFHEIRDFFEAECFTPLPYKTFEREAYEDAFETLWRSNHIGKVLVRMNKDDAENHPGSDGLKARTSTAEFRPQEKDVYIVTGGNRGFGFEILKWLIQKGARNIAALSQSGKIGAGISAADTRLLEGANVRFYACDMGNRCQVDKAVEQVCKDFENLDIKGAVHAASMIRDEKISNIEKENFDAVLLSKAMGAKNLSECLESHNLDFFVVVSSISAHIGNFGQAAYAASNLYCEELVKQRRKNKQHGLAIAFGPIADSGLLVSGQNSEILNKIRDIGLYPVKTRTALNKIEDALVSDADTVIYSPADWTKASRVFPRLSAPAYTPLLPVIHADRITGNKDKIFEDFMSKNSSEQEKIIIEILKSELANLLLTKKEKIESSMPLADLGIDSLLAMELGLSIEKTFEVKLDQSSFSFNTTVRTLAEIIKSRIIEKIKCQESENVTVKNVHSQDQLEDLAARHLSEEEQEKTVLKLKDNISSPRSDSEKVA